MKKGILVLMTLFSIISCGMKKIDGELSNNYYKNTTGGIVYSRNGNWYELGKKELENVKKRTYYIMMKISFKNSLISFHEIEK